MPIAKPIYAGDYDTEGMRLKQDPSYIVSDYDCWGDPRDVPSRDGQSAPRSEQHSGTQFASGAHSLATMLCHGLLPPSPLSFRPDPRQPDLLGLPQARAGRCSSHFASREVHRARLSSPGVLWPCACLGFRTLSSWSRWHTGLHWPTRVGPTATIDGASFHDSSATLLCGCNGPVHHTSNSLILNTQ